MFLMGFKCPANRPFSYSSKEPESKDIVVHGALFKRARKIENTLGPIPPRLSFLGAAYAKSSCEGNDSKGGYL